MKKTILLLLSLAMVFLSGAQAPLNVMTFNIRYNTPNDSLNAWPYRKDKAASQILFHEAHIVGVQEALHGQLTDLLERMPRYKYVGVGRDDGKEKGEFSAIFYDTARLQLLQTQTFWLSEQPTVAGSKSWDAAITRIVTWAKFRDRINRKTFFAFNTHFDHIGKIARRESAKLLLQKIHDIAGTTTIIVTGDFNATPADEPIQVITDVNNSLHLTDTKAISQLPHYGPLGTFSGFGASEKTNEPIDYIFIRKGIRVLQHATLSQNWGGRYSSDHYPVFARLLFN
jgi:endonuclease/exonuclease/phosphatase family metal-dependent hydrolase